MRRGLVAFSLALCAAQAQTVSAQGVQGRTFEDRNANGIRDAGEPALSGVSVRLFGTAGGGGIDQVTTTASDGLYGFSPGNGCYLLAPEDPPGFRMSHSRDDAFSESTPGYLFPVGQPRLAKLDRARENLAAGPFTYAAVGDSIAWNFNICGYPESFWYSKQIRARLACVAPAATVTLNQAAIKGEHTDDLLVNQAAETNNVFRLIDLAPELITISMIGNDLLDVDPGASPTQPLIHRAVAEVLDARQNLQEVLSSLESALPDVDIGLNTLYDNEAYNCNTGNPSAFHRAWLPIVDRILRDLAWGQTRRVSINEVAADFAHEDQLGACKGYDQLICRDPFLLDTIHPTNPGYTLVREKVWEGIGGVNLGPGDALGRTSMSGVDYGYLRLVRRLSPRSFEVLGGATVQDGGSALDADDVPARITLGAASEEFRLSAFPDWFDEVQIVRVIAGVRYRTTGTVGDDFYRMEASVNGTFRPPPGFAYTPTAWNFYTPIVGAGGPNQPLENPDYPTAKVLAVPDAPGYREASALLTKNPVLPAGAASYAWPAVTHDDLATATLRVASAPVALTPGNDEYEVELDHAWLDLYGWEKLRPAEVEHLLLARPGDGTLRFSFEPVAGAERYNLYTGRLNRLPAGDYDHGSGAPSGPLCGAATVPIGGGRLEISQGPGGQASGSVYYLVTAHVDDVESPTGFASDATEIDRSESICK